MTSGGKTPCNLCREGNGDRGALPRLRSHRVETPGRRADCTVSRAEGGAMMRSILAAAFLVGTQLTVGACQPVYRDRSFSERQEHQRDRIDEGRADGDLSRREAARLRDRSRDIAEDRRDARA